METTWIFIIIGILILFFLLTHTIIIHTYNIQTPPREKGEMVYKNDLPSQLYVDTKTKSSDLHVKKNQTKTKTNMNANVNTNTNMNANANANTNTNTNTNVNTKTNANNIVNVPIPIPYVTQNVANTSPYPPVSSSTSL